MTAIKTDKLNKELVKERRKASISVPLGSVFVYLIDANYMTNTSLHLVVLFFFVSSACQSVSSKYLTDDISKPRLTSRPAKYSTRKSDISIPPTFNCASFVAKFRCLKQHAGYSYSSLLFFLFPLLCIWTARAPT